MNGFKLAGLTAAMLLTSQLALADNLSLRLNYAQGKTGVAFQATHVETGHFAITPKREHIAGPSWRLVSRNSKGVIVYETEIANNLTFHAEGFDPKTGQIAAARTVQLNAGVLEVSIPYGTDVASIEVLPSNKDLAALAKGASAPSALAKFDRNAINGVKLKTKAERLNMLAATAAAGGTPTVATIVDSGPPAQRMDIVLLAEGYTAAEMGKWQMDANRIATGMLNDPVFNNARAGISIRRVDVASVESGADEPDKGIYRSTAFDATYNCGGVERSICLDDSKVLGAVSSVLAPDARDFIVIVVNSTRYGGAATMGVSARVASDSGSEIDMALHEMGHSAFLLADEYDLGNCAAGEPAEPDVTRNLSRTQAKWGSKIAGSTPVPTPINALPNGTVGMFVGGKYCTTGIYRPTENSKMRTLGLPWHAVNEAVLNSVINKYYTACPSQFYTRAIDPTYGDSCRLNDTHDGTSCAFQPWDTASTLQAAGWTILGNTCKTFAGGRLTTVSLFVKPRP